MITRINNFLKKYPHEGISPIWNIESSFYSKSEISEEDFEEASNNGLYRGYYGGNPYDVCFRGLLNLAKAYGICGIDNSEMGIMLRSKSNIEIMEVEKILDLLEIKLGFPLIFPSYNGNCTGNIKSSKGNFTQREMFSLYLLKRIMELYPDRNTKILEVGAGLGILGYFLDCAGYKNYTIIDLSRTNACQAFYLYKALPHRNIILTDEVDDYFSSEHNTDIKIIHFSKFNDINGIQFDVLINNDSFTEMCFDDASNYINRNVAKQVLSINHEVNEFRVIDICKPNYRIIYRFPCWVRDFYVEELYNLEL